MSGSHVKHTASKVVVPFIAYGVMGDNMLTTVLINVGSNGVQLLLG